MMTIPVMPARDPVPVHPSITEEQICQLVDRFYGQVREDERLAAVFNPRLEGRWDDHLIKMKDFWSSVLLRTGRYKGKPMVAHAKLDEAKSEDFKIWLELFRATVHDIFEPEAVPLVIKTAERIAESLWLGMFATPFDRTPDWMRSA